MCVLFLSYGVYLLCRGMELGKGDKVDNFVFELYVGS